MKQSKVFNESGKGYWMEGFGCIRAEGENRPSRPGHIVIALEGNGARPSHMGNGYSDSGKMYTLNTIEQHSVCYTVDCRNLCLNEEKSGTLQAKNEGGFSYNFLNPVLMENKDEESDVSG